MCDADAGLALTFNGEIYNFRELREQLIRAGFRFALDSDTEVLLRAYQHWKGDVVHRLRGMFAFAIWDAREQSLFLARDRFGEKPLFLHQRGGSLYFASEIKSLLRVPGVERAVDLESAWQYLAYRYVPGPATLFAGIRKLPPATTALWRRGTLVETRYWSPPDREAQSPPRVAGRRRRRLLAAARGSRAPADGGGRAGRRFSLRRYRLVCDRGADEPSLCACEDVFRRVRREPLQRAAVRGRKSPGTSERTITN